MGMEARRKLPSGPLSSPRSGRFSHHPSGSRSPTGSIMVMVITTLLVMLVVVLCVGLLEPTGITIDVPIMPAAAASSLSMKNCDTASASTNQRLPRSNTPNSAAPIVAVPTMDLGVKPGSKVIINIGSNLDPIVPRAEYDDPCTISIAFEPIPSVHHNIRKHPALYAVPAAVSDHSGWTTMNVYNRNGRSSSLGTARKEANWNTGQQNHGRKIVPLLDLLTVLQTLQQPAAAPPSATTNSVVVNSSSSSSSSSIASGKYQVQFLMTDMQGFDFATISSVPPSLWKTDFPIPHIMTEVYLEGVSSYSNVANDLCRDWLPYMTKAGYVFEGLLNALVFDGSVNPEPGYESQKALEETCRRQQQQQQKGTKQDDGVVVLEDKLMERDALWRHSSQQPTQNITATYVYPKHSKKQAGPQFEDSQYQACSTTTTTTSGSSTTTGN